MPDTIPFNQIPSTLRLPGVFIEVDASKAGRSFNPGRMLLIGQMLVAGTAVAGMPVPVVSQDDANVKFGAGSQLAAMFAAARSADPLGLMFALPLADAGGGVAATGTITVTGAPTGPGVIPLYIGGVKIPVPVTGTESVTQTAAEIVAAINANPNLSVTAANAAGVVTLTARNKGALGNDLDVRYAWLGAAGGEALPPSYVGAIVAMGGVVAGASDPTITAAVANLGDTTYDFIVMAYTDAANMNAAAALMNAPGGRWDYNRMLWGHVFTAARLSPSAATTYGATRNDPHITVLPFYQSPTPVWIWVAAYVAATAVVLRNDPARPVQSVLIPGVLAPPLGSVGQFTMAERQTLLWSGMSTFTIDNFGNCYIERLISTYQFNVQNLPDDSWLAVEKTFTLMAVLRKLQARLYQDFPRYKLAHDGTRIAPGAAITTPSKLRAYIIALLREMEEDDGWLDDVDAFVDAVQVEISSNANDRVNILFPPSLIEQLRIFAVLAQFHNYVP